MILFENWLLWSLDYAAIKGMCIWGQFGNFIERSDVVIAYQKGKKELRKENLWFLLASFFSFRWTKSEDQVLWISNITESVLRRCIFQLSPTSDYSNGILQHPILRNGKGIRKVNRMKPPVTLKNSMLRREILQKVLLIEQYTIRSCSSCQSFHASWLTPPLCIMFLDANLVCRSTKLAQEILFIWTPPLVGFDKLNFVECSLSNLG